MAAATADIAARITLLDTCKEATSMLAAWSMFPKDSYSRISRHIATAVRRVESQGSRGLQAIDGLIHKTVVTARMAANIPYRIVWSAKHGKTPESSPEVQHPTLPLQEGHTLSGTVPGADSLYLQNGSQPFDLLFNDLDDVALFNNMNDVDFTDIWLDWETLKGPIPNWT